jgi:hypothetical protein
LDLKGRVRSLERRHATRLDQLSSQDSRRGDSVLPQQLCSWTDLLRAEQSTFDQIREATRQMIALISDMASDVARLNITNQEGANLDDAWEVALSAVSQDDVRGLRAACEATLDRLCPTRHGIAPPL